MSRVRHPPSAAEIVAAHRPFLVELGMGWRQQKGLPL